MLWAIRNKTNGLWWSDEWGWGTKKGRSLYVVDNPSVCTLTLPIDGKWVQVKR